MAGHKIVSRSEWLQARQAHLAQEKEFTRARDALSRARFARAQELTRTGRLRAARALLEDAIRDEPGASATRLALADSLRFTGEADVGEAQIRAMLDRDPDDLIARRMLAVALARRGARCEAVLR